MMVLMAGLLVAQDEEKDPNVIENGSFEETTGKLKKLGQLPYAVGWTTANEEKADLFSTYSETEINGVPKNEMGMCNPREGSNYAGFLVHNVVSKDGREYLTSKLKETLKKDQKYCISYSISLADVAKYATNNLGFYFSKKESYEDKDVLIKDAVYPRLNRPQSKMEGWQNLCMTSTGKGDEKFITIGNFASASAIVTEKVRKPSDITQEQMSIGYYYIDNIRMVPVSRESDCTCKEESANEGPKIIYSSAAGLADNASSADIVASSTVYFYENEEALVQATKNTLDKLATLMTTKTKLSLTIHGHMDENEVKKSKTLDRFRDYSKMRAEMVKKYLVEKGVDASRLSIRSHEDSEPATSMKTPLSMAKNRRVQFVIELD